jgi:hypothetical protein
MSVAELAEKSLATVNELLPRCEPTGAYCIGLMCALAWRDGLDPPRTLLELAAKCPSVEDAAELYREFKALRAQSLRGDFR